MKLTKFTIRKDSNWEYTAQGYLKVKAYATRSGVFTYRENGKTIFEGRLPEYVNDLASLETLKNVPLTNDHPTVMLDTSNTKQYQVGYTGDRVEIEADGLIGIDLIVTDKDTILAIISGLKVELSCGYTCVIVWISGIYNGEKYDCIQTEIIYNHVAICNEGRAGHKVRISLDSSSNEKESIRFDSENNTVFRCDDNFDNNIVPQEEIKTVKFNCDGVEVDIPDNVATTVIAAQTKRDEQIKTLTASITDIKSQMDSLSGELTMTKASLDTAKKVDHTAIAKAHNLLVNNVAKFVKDSNVDEMMDLGSKELKIMALKAVNPNHNYDTESDNFIESAYKFIENQVPAATETKADSFKNVLDAANGNPAPKPKMDARQTMIDKMKNKHKGSN